MSYKETKFDEGPPGDNVDSTDSDKEKKKDEEIEKKKEDELPPVSFMQLFQYADCLDWFLIIFGLIFACAGGVTFPIMVIFLGDIFDAFVANQTGREQKFTDILTDFLWQMCLIGSVAWLVYYLFVTCMNTAAERQVFRIRRLFLESVLKQDIGWYDTNTSTDFASKMTQNLNKLLEGMGEKIGMALSVMARFVASLVIAFTYGWKLTFILFGIMIPMMIFIGAITAKFMKDYAGKEMKSYGEAGAVAEEVLGAIRTVSAFGGELKEVVRYEEFLLKAKKSGIMRGLFTGLAGGFSFAIIFIVWGVSMWFGVMFVRDSFLDCNGTFPTPPVPPINGSDYMNPLDGNYTCTLCITSCGEYQVSNVITVLNSIFMGAMGVAMMTVYTESIMQAKAAAAGVFQVVNRIPAIDSSSNQGVKPSTFIGNLTFKNVFFNYPARKEVPILRGFDLQIKSGSSVALVGPSGCGKSTCVQLIQRFYDPDGGSLLLDGQDIKEINIGWLRDNIGIVSQEPVLFNMSVKENIKFGNQACSEEDIIRACKEANAYSFIMKLPKKFDTNVGEGGTQLSGGQKQRIAIARALVRNPKILLLDEATSALDTQSEGVVQAALDKAQAGRTTVIVAHRLTTVRNCDQIIALNDGKVAETGTHDELMKMEGLYHGLVTRQINIDEEEEEALDTINETEESALANGVKNRKMSRQLSRKLSRSNSHTSGRNSNKLGRQGSHVSDDFRYDNTDVEPEEKVPNGSITKILKANSPEILYLVAGLLCSAAYGAFYPSFAELFGRMTEIFVYAFTDPERANEEALFYMLMFCALGLGTGALMFTMSLMFAIAGENLTMRLRKQSFEAMLRQEMGWFDKPSNTTGALCARLSADTSKVQSATGARVGQILTGIIGLILAVCLAMFYSVKLGAVCSAFLPILMGSYIAMMKLAKVVDSSETKAFEGASKLAIEAITNIRTVAGLRCENTFLTMYIDLLEEPHKLMMKKAHVRGVIFGLANSIGIFSYGVCMYYGGYLIDNENLPFTNVLKASQAINGGAGMIGGSFAFMDEISRAIVAAGRVFHLLERVPAIDSSTFAGLKQPDASGNIDIKDVDFSYPTREKIKVLDKLSMAVKSGQKIGLVGHSGCGKSTVIQLIQRFYNASSGEFKLDDENIEALNVPWVRSKLGIVSQEPTLFNRTIAENIQYGDNTRTVSMEETIEAAKRANIHNFVAALPSGYETKVGGKGTQLSGGQKQRVAIARALVRNPRILLLDEATSALDSESEGIVQEALEAAQEGRTSITIAHRLSTIQASDVIFVIDVGCVAESGTHQDLLKLKGIYHDLWTNTTM